MAAEAQRSPWTGPSRRRTPRFTMQEPLDVTVLRSGVPDKVPGRGLNLCERGLAAILAGDVIPGEYVGVEVRLSVVAEPLRARGQVRYQENLRCGLEFVGLSTAQRSTIQDCTKKLRAEGEDATAKIPEAKRKVSRDFPTGAEVKEPPKKSKRNYRIAGTILVLVVLAFTGGVFWWRWNRGWEELESGLRTSEAASAERPQAQVPAEVMEKLLVHRVEPAYPAAARQARMEGTIAVDLIVGRDGTVLSMRALNGPDVLAGAAMDALRWWRFQPYRVNGEPATVETRMAIEFKR